MVFSFQVGAERSVSFDHGREGSIAEDCFFSMIAFRDGYTFDFIEGKSGIITCACNRSLASFAYGSLFLSNSNVRDLIWHT